MMSFHRAMSFIAAMLVLMACGAPEAERPGAEPSAPGAAREEGSPRALSAVAVDPEASRARDVSTGDAPEAHPARRFELVSRLWVEMDGDNARLKFTVELENLTSDVATPTFLKIEQQNWVIQDGIKRGVGGGTIGIRRPLELAPGERAYMHRGDFTTLGASEFRRGAYAGAGMTGSVTLQDESGATFALPFRHAVKFSIDENGNPLSETWSDPPVGEPIPPPDL